MPTPPLSDEALVEAVHALHEHGGVKKYAADSLGLDRNTFVHRLRVAARRGLDGIIPGPVPEGFEIRSRSVQYGPDGEIKGQSVKQGVETNGPFHVPNGHLVKGVSALLNADGEVVNQWIKTTQGALHHEELVKTIKAAFEGWNAPQAEIAHPGNTDNETLTIYPLADMHLGLKATAHESGADFDLDIACERFRATTSRLFERSPNSETALILQLGDWTHADDNLALTPASKNAMQVSDRMLEVVRAGVKIMVDYIYFALNKHEKIIVKCLPGNHDLNAWITLYVALAEHFRENDRVIIDGGAADYWFLRFGSTLIGAHHGHRMKPEQMAGAMAMECREDWGETDHRLFLHGHLHHQMVKEVLGVRVECFRTIAEADQFHSGKYGSGKSLLSITIHRENGEDGRAQINLPPVKKRAVSA